MRILRRVGGGVYIGTDSPAAVVNTTEKKQVCGLGVGGLNQNKRL